MIRERGVQTTSGLLMLFVFLMLIALAVFGVFRAARADGQLEPVA